MIAVEAFIFAQKRMRGERLYLSLMQSVAILLLLTSTTLTTVSASALTMDYSMECKPGYRVSSIRRLASQYEKSGALTIYCDLIEEDPQKVFCERLPTTPQCSGAAEGCTGPSWLAGFHAYLLEDNTEATLLEPICCQSSRVQINEESCIHDRLNKPTQPFQHAIADDMLYRGIQCWHMYDNRNNTLQDIVWKMGICGYNVIDMEENNSIKNEFSRCNEGCECFCGIEQCANGRYPIKIIHRAPRGAQNADPCECHCTCVYKCL